MTRSKHSVTIQGISPFSAGKILGAVYGCLGLLMGGVWSLIRSSGLSSPPKTSNDPMANILFGPGAVIVLPLVYGVTACLMGIILGLSYNLVATVFGGLEIAIDQKIDKAEH